MQETVFKLTERPFSVDVRVERYFPAESIEAARTSIARTIERAEGCSLIVGPPGSGKTMLCHALAEQFADRFSSVFLSGGRLPSRKALLQAILFELGLPYRRMDEGELRLALIDYLSPRESESEGMLLLVDEAHTLSPKLLEELRLLTNLVRQGSPRVRLVLAGGAILEERFASPKLAAFNQRLTARGYLEPFSSEETQQFICAQLAAAGGTPDHIFTDKALRAIHRSTDGVARLINQLCDHALLLASAGTQPGQEPSPIDERGVEEAWADLQQLPMPWNMDRAPEGPLDGDSSTTVEFASTDSDSPGDEFDDELNEVDSERAQTVPFAPAEAAIDPSDQLDRIQGHLDSVEDDFQPAGSIGPQVELAFDKVDNPFGEEYANKDGGDIADEFDEDLGPVVDPSASPEMGGAPDKSGMPEESRASEGSDASDASGTLGRREAAPTVPGVKPPFTTALYNSDNLAFESPSSESPASEIPSSEMPLPEEASGPMPSAPLPPLESRPENPGWESVTESTPPQAENNLDASRMRTPATPSESMPEQTMPQGELPLAASGSQQEPAFDPASDPVYPPVGASTGDLASEAVDAVMPLASDPVATDPMAAAEAAEFQVHPSDLAPSLQLDAVARPDLQFDSGTVEPTSTSSLSTEAPIVDPVTVNPITAERTALDSMATPTPEATQETKPDAKAPARERKAKGSRRYGQLFSGLRKEGR